MNGIPKDGTTFLFQGDIERKELRKKWICIRQNK
jgi:hypothetical protein